MDKARKLFEKAQQLESGFCNPMKNKFADECREQAREDLERRGFNQHDIRLIESEYD